MQPDGLGEEAGGDGHEQHEGEAFAALASEWQCETRVREPTEQHGQAEESHYLRQRDGYVHGLERPAGQHPDHEAETTRVSRSSITLLATITRAKRVSESRGP